MDLLEFYYTYAFERKRAEAHQGEKSADQVRLFQLCGRIALAITQRNQGTDIGQDEVDRLLGNESASAIDAARLAGLLQQSTTDESVSLRFEHHRAQEYFTARCIAKEHSEFDWSGKLDLPRWQETLVNVAQMGGATSALEILSETLGSAPSEIKGKTQPIDRILSETLATERVELAVRIARDLPISPGREELQHEISAAISWFLENGSAVSKVKMLRLAQQAPHLVSIETIRHALNDKAAWVRDQAHIVAARLAGSATAAGLPDELIYNFVTGRLVRRLPNYFVLSRGLKNWSVFLLALFGVMLLTARSIVLGGSGPLIILLSDHLAPLWPPGWKPALEAFNELARVPGYEMFVSLISLLVAVSGVFFHRSKTWLYLQSISLASLAVPVVVIMLWSYDGILSIQAIFFTAFAAIFVGYAIGLPLLALGGLIVTLFFALIFAIGIYFWTREWGYTADLIRSSWRDGEFSEFVPDFIPWSGRTVVRVFRFVASHLKPLAAVGGSLAAAALFYYITSSAMLWKQLADLLGTILFAVFVPMFMAGRVVFDYVSVLPYLGPIGIFVISGALLVCFACLAVGGVLLLARRSFDHRYFDHTIPLVFAFGSIIVAMMAGLISIFGEPVKSFIGRVLSLFISFLDKVLISFLDEVFGRWFAKAAVVIIVVVAFLAALYVFREVFSFAFDWIKYRIAEFRKFKLSQGDWHAQFQEATPTQQARTP